MSSDSSTSKMQEQDISTKKVSQDQFNDFGDKVFEVKDELISTKDNKNNEADDVAFKKDIQTTQVADIEVKSSFEDGSELRKEIFKTEQDQVVDEESVDKSEDEIPKLDNEEDTKLDLEKVTKKESVSDIEDSTENEANLDEVFEIEERFQEEEDEIKRLKNEDLTERSEDEDLVKRLQDEDLVEKLEDETAKVNQSV